MSTGPARPWEDTTKPPRERAEALVAAMTLEQKIAQLHGAMETVDIYGMQERAKEEGADLDALAAQIRVERHVAAIDELGIPPVPHHQRAGRGRHGRRPPQPQGHLAADDDRAGGRVRPRAGPRVRLHHRQRDRHPRPARPRGPRCLPAPAADLGPQLRVLQRGPLPQRGHGRPGHPRHPGPRRHRHGQALRAQRPGDRALPRQRRGRRPRAARAVPAALRDARQGRRHRRDDERLQPDPRRLRHRVPPHPHRHPAHRVGLRGLRPVRLLVHPLGRPVAERRPGPRDAGRQVAQRGERQGRPAGHQPGDRDRRPGAGARLHPDVPVRPVRASVRARRDRRAGPRRPRPPDRHPDRRPAQERRRRAADRPPRGDHRHHRAGRVCRAGHRGRGRQLEGRPALHRPARGRHARRRPGAGRVGHGDGRRGRPGQPGGGQGGGGRGRRRRADGRLCGQRGRGPAGHGPARRPGPDDRRDRAGQPAHRGRAQGQQPGADAVDRRGPRGPGGLEPGRRGRPRRRRPRPRRGQPLRQAADHLPPVRGRDDHGRPPGAAPGHRRGGRLPRHPLQRGPADGLPLVPGQRDPGGRDRRRPRRTHHPLSVWSRGEHAFVVEPGEYTVHVGTSSEDTPVRETFTVTG